MAARLDHAHIVPVYDFGEAEGSIFLAMKYMPGGSLKDWLARQGTVSYPQAVEITRQVASALDYAHRQAEKLVHRDVKPGNILFDAEPTETEYHARLADFGFSKALLGAKSASLSASGAMIGTPAYMAPEIWLGQEASPATDVYSLACVFVEMLTGKPLFSEGDTPPPLVMKRHFDPLRLPESWPPSVPQRIAAVLAKALAKEPGERYANPGELASALGNIEQRLQPILKHSIKSRHEPQQIDIPKGTLPALKRAAVNRLEPQLSNVPSREQPNLKTYPFIAAGIIVVAAVIVAILLGNQHQDSVLESTSSPTTMLASTTFPTSLKTLAPTCTPSLTPIPTLTLSIGSTKEL